MARTLTRKDKFIEKLPGFISIAIMIFPVIGGIFFPLPTAYFVIVFNVYFLYKSISFFILLLVALIRIRNTENINWWHKIQETVSPEEGIKKIKSELEIIKKENYKNHKSKLDKDRSIPNFLDKFAFRLEKSKPFF